MVRSLRNIFITFYSLLFVLTLPLQKFKAFSPFNPIIKNEYKIAIVEIKTGKSRHITTGFQPRVLPCSDKIIFSSPQGLSVIDQDGKNEKLLIKALKPLGYFNVSADGKKIALYRNDGGHQLVVINSDGSGYKKIFDINYPKDPYPVLSPKSDKILFINGCDLAIINTDGSNYKTLKASNKSSYYDHPRFLPDNDRIIFFEDDRDKENNAKAMQIKVMSLSSGKETVIGKFNQAMGLEVAKNGLILLRDLKGKIITKIIDSNNNFKVIYSFKDSYENSLSPDGKYIVAYTNSSISICDTDGRNKRIILKDKVGTVSRFPEITNDGKYI
ncbi:MAG: hypothetical protein ACM34K_08000, partial [Bacillota bacterium]